MSAQQVIELPPDDLTPAELQAAARDHFLQSAANGETQTGADLGRRFGRSERWGRDRIAECRTSNDASVPASTPAPDEGERTGTAADPLPPGSDHPGQAAQRW